MGSKAEARGMAASQKLPTHWVVVFGLLFTYVVFGLLDVARLPNAAIRTSNTVRLTASTTGRAGDGFALRADEAEAFAREAGNDAERGDEGAARPDELSEDEMEGASNVEVADFGSMDGGGRGWHWQTRYDSDEENWSRTGPGRRRGFPYALPAVEDPGEEYVRFDVSKVLPEFAKAERLVMDVSVLRLTDDFGLIDDMLSYEQLEDIVRRVVDIYAAANVYVRVNQRDLRERFKLSRKKALAYMGYVEGPDLAEQVDSQKPEASKISTNPSRNGFVEWFREQMRLEFPAPSLELLLRGPKNGLTIPGPSDNKRWVSNTVIDWVLGYPNMLPPWDVLHTTTVFPVYFSREFGAQASAGRIIAATGSCNPDAHAVKHIKSTNGVATCKGFEFSLFKRLETPHVSAGEAEQLLNNPEVVARMWAHELGHSIGLAHPRNQCTLFTTYSEGFLMQPAQLVGRRGAGCSGLLGAEQHQATKFNRKQIERLRARVQQRDVRQSRPLPGAVTVGESTMQIGSASPNLYDRILRSQRGDIAGAGRRPLTQFTDCTLPQSVVVFTRLPSPVSGTVQRVRWLPSKFSSFETTVHVLVVRAVQDLEQDANVEFRVVDQTDGPVKVPRSAQNMHVELDLARPLKVGAGDMLALASADGKRLNIDHRAFASDRVLYADVVGQFTRSSMSLFEPLTRFESTRTTYPRVALAPRLPDSFFFSSQRLPPSAASFVAQRTESMRQTNWCTELIANFDVLPGP